MIWWLAIGWIACGVTTFGLAFADFQASCPTIADECRREDYGAATFFALMGPFGLLIAILSTGFAKHGWRIR